MKNFTNSFSSFCEHRCKDLFFGIKNIYGQVVIPAEYQSKIEAVNALEDWKRKREENDKQK